jgi:hypothetical protein
MRAYIIIILLALSFVTNCTTQNTSIEEKAEERAAETTSEHIDSELTIETQTSLLPLGDGKYTSSPKKGYIYSCNTRFHGVGAFKDGTWIEDDVWDPSEKVTVDGEVVWENAEITITRTEDERIIESNDLPTEQTTGIFPIAKTDDAYLYDRNPNSIEEQTIKVSLIRNPALAEAPSCVGQGAIGVMLNGVLLFNGFDAGGRDAVAHEIQDSCDGHPQETGQYHYHSESICLEDTKDSDMHSGLLGYALDGFGIYGKYGEEGILLYTDDLDECHGHVHEIMWDEETKEIYHYHFTEEFPYSIGCFKGTPISIEGSS